MLGSEFQSLLEQAQRGSLAALGALYEHHQPSTLAYLRARAGQDAEDLAADVWVDVARGLSRFSGDEGNFRAWVFTIARRRAIDARRRSYRRNTEPTTVETMSEIKSHDDPAEQAVTQLQAAEAIEAMDQLTSDQADVIALRVIGGLSVEETAAAMHKRPGTVRVLQHRALQALARILQDASEEDEDA